MKVQLILFCFSIQKKNIQNIEVIHAVPAVYEAHVHFHVIQN